MSRLPGESWSQWSYRVFGARDSERDEASLPNSPLPEPSPGADRPADDDLSPLSPLNRLSPHEAATIMLLRSGIDAVRSKRHPCYRIEGLREALALIDCGYPLSQSHDSLLIAYSRVLQAQTARIHKRIAELEKELDS